MFTSVTDKNRRKLLRQAIAYFGVTLFCIFFSIVYEIYSHNVYSGYMIFMFAFPLIGGFVPSVAFTVSKKLPAPERLTRNVMNSAVATLTVGSCFSGILEIYGTTSKYAFIYWLAGLLLALIGILSYVLLSLRKKRL